MTQSVAAKNVMQFSSFHHAGSYAEEIYTFVENKITCQSPKTIQSTKLRNGIIVFIAGYIRQRRETNATSIMV
jgi:ribosomal protein S17E